MSTDVVFRPEASAEVAEARQWYEERQAGLGEEFLLCMNAAIEQIRRQPKSGPAVHGDVRRVLLRRFPYGVFYLIEPERVVVLAVFHGRRNPAEWRRRQ